MGTKARVDLGELGRSGLTRFGGIVSEEWLPELQGTRGAEIYRRMSTGDPIVGGMLFAVNMFCKSVPWFAQPGGEERKDREAARFLQSCLFDMSASWPSTLAEILTMLPFGWSYLEIVYKIRKGPGQKDGRFRSRYRDGRIGWRKWAPRAQETLSEWIYDEKSDSLKGMVQIGPPDYQEHRIPIEKAILFRTTNAKGNPEGQSILRSAYRPWYLKTHIEEIEGMGIERDLVGFPVLYVAKSVVEQKTDEAKRAFNEYRRLVTNLRRDELEGLVLPSATDDHGNRLYELKLLSSAGSRQFNTGQIISRYETRIAMSIMADFLLLGQEKAGSYALSETKARLFSQAITAMLDNITETINAYAVPRLFELNTGFDLEELPKIAHGKVGVPNLEQLGVFLQRISASGARWFPDERLENHLRGLADLPPKADPQGVGPKKPSEDEQTEREEDPDPKDGDPDADDDELEKARELLAWEGQPYQASILKADEDKHLVYGVVSEPSTVDAQGDVLSEEEIERFAHDFLVRSRRMGERHRSKARALIVESWVAKFDFEWAGQLVRRGSWIVGVKVLDEEIWAKIKAGIYRAFSIGGRGVRVPRVRFDRCGS